MVSGTETRNDDVLFVREENMPPYHTKHSNIAPVPLLRPLQENYSIKYQTFTEQNTLDINCIEHQKPKEFSDYNECSSTSTSNNTIATAQVEFIDVNCVTSNNSSFNDSDQDDDVIFVGAYQNTVPLAKNLNVNKSGKKNDAEKSDRVRRNPVRQARLRIPSKNSSFELFGDELAFLDDSDGEHMENPQKKSPSPPVFPKTWPINVHERPEYNPITQQVEPLDHNLRVNAVSATGPMRKGSPDKASAEVKKKVPVKKNKRFKMATRKNSKKVVKKVPISELLIVVNNTTNALKEFVESAENDSMKKDFYNENLKLWENQFNLQSLINIMASQKLE